MTERNQIPAESKIIIGVEYSEKTTWYSLHLHDALFAISIRPDQQRVVIAEGRGRGRLRHLRIPFKNIFRFETVEVPIGHSCVEEPVDPGALGESYLIQRDKPFTPVMVRLLLKHSTRSDFISIHDVGATPLPIIVPLLRNLPEERLANADISLRSADDCFLLAKKLIEWVRNVNADIERARGVDLRKVAPAITQPVQTIDDRVHETLRRVFGELDSFSKPEVQETLISSLAEIRVSTLLQPHLMEKNSRMINAARFRYYNFPLSLASQIDDPASSVTIDHLVEASKLYQEKTGQPIEGVLDAIGKRVEELKQRRATIESNKEAGLLEENAPKPSDIIDPTRLINEKKCILTGNKLRHEDQLRRVFENEGIEVCYVANLPFLSLLVEYHTKDGGKYYAAIIKEGLHQALNEFLLAHEMGHWFLHVNAKSPDRFEQIDRWLRSSAQRRLLEEEADNFAMALLFPPAYLADRVFSEQGLSVDNLFDEFVAGMKSVGGKLKAQMRHYIRDHIEKQKKFKKAKEPSFLTIEVEFVEEKNLEVLLDLIRQGKDPVDWVRLDKDSNILEASKNAEKLFGRSNAEILSSKPTDLVVPEEIEFMEARSKYRREHKTAIYYLTEVTHKAENTTRKVLVYSFPILNNGEYVGAIAALRPLDEFESEASSFGFSRDDVAQWNNVHLIDFSDVTAPA